MAIQPMALQVQNPTPVNGVDNFAKGMANKIGLDAAKLEQAQRGISAIGSIALGAMGGDMNGQVNPQHYEQGLDMMEAQGVNVSAYRGKPEVAPLIARASLTTMEQLQTAKSEREYELALRKFEHDLQQAAKGPGPTAAMQNWDWAHGDPEKQSYLGIGAQSGARPLTDPAERAQWGIPAEDTRPYYIEPGKAPAVVGGSGGQEINVYGEGSGDGAFFGALDKADGEVFADLLKEAPNIGRKAVQIEQLEGLLGNINTGGGAAVQQLAGEWGINTEGLDAIQAVQALINQIVPEQRQPGSGPMSDSDLALFKQSIPRVINQPGGNQMIIDTMRGINEYTRMQSNIAARLAAREITRDEARAALAALPNPLAGYAERVKGSMQGGVAKPTTRAEYDALPSGAIFIDPDDGLTYRKP